MTVSSLSSAWKSLADSLHVLVLRFPVADPRRQRVSTDAISAGDQSLDTMADDDGPREDQLAKLAGRVSTLNLDDHTSFDALMREIESLFARNKMAG